ncbi:hypothetical protein PCE1_002813 [Barthelona sp. PCE]
MLPLESAAPIYLTWLQCWTDLELVFYFTTFFIFILTILDMKLLFSIVLILLLVAMPVKSEVLNVEILDLKPLLSDFCDLDNYNGPTTISTNVQEGLINNIAAYCTEQMVDDMFPDEGIITKQQLNDDVGMDIISIMKQLGGSETRPKADGDASSLATSAIKGMSSLSAIGIADYDSEAGEVKYGYFPKKDIDWDALGAADTETQAKLLNVYGANAATAFALPLVILVFLMLWFTLFLVFLPISCCCACCCSKKKDHKWKGPGLCGKIFLSALATVVVILLGMSASGLSGLYSSYDNIVTGAPVIDTLEAITSQAPNLQAVLAVVPEAVEEVVNTTLDAFGLNDDAVWDAASTLVTAAESLPAKEDVLAVLGPAVDMADAMPDQDTLNNLQAQLDDDSVDPCAENPEIVVEIAQSLESVADSLESLNETAVVELVSSFMDVIVDITPAISSMMNSVAGSALSNVLNTTGSDVDSDGFVGNMTDTLVQSLNVTAMEEQIVEMITAVNTTEIAEMIRALIPPMPNISNPNNEDAVNQTAWCSSFDFAEYSSVMSSFGPIIASTAIVADNIDVIEMIPSAEEMDNYLSYIPANATVFQEQKVEFFDNVTTLITSAADLLPTVASSASDKFQERLFNDETGKIINLFVSTFVESLSTLTYIIILPLILLVVLTWCKCSPCIWKCGKILTNIFFFLTMIILLVIMTAFFTIGSAGSVGCTILEDSASLTSVIDLVSDSATNNTGIYEITLGNTTVDFELAAPIKDTFCIASGIDWTQPLEDLVNAFINEQVNMTKMVKDVLATASDSASGMLGGNVSIAGDLESNIVGIIDNVSTDIVDGLGAFLEDVFSCNGLGTMYNALVIDTVCHGFVGSFAAYGYYGVLGITLLFLTFCIGCCCVKPKNVKVEKTHSNIEILNDVAIMPAHDPMHMQVQPADPYMNAYTAPPPMY